ncbi:MAG: GGDEF domain-containing protein, partial [Sphaerochaetaceae bacterium]
GVYDGRSDNPVGFIVINYLVDYLFKTLDQIMLDAKDLLCMVNTDGYYLYGVEPSHAWGWLFPERSGYTLAQDNPELWEQISQSDAGRLKQQDASWFFIANDITKAAEYDIARIKGGMMENTVASLRYAERLILVLKVPRSYWMEETVGVRQVLWIVGIICFLLSPIASLRFYRVKKHNEVLHEQLVQDAKFDAFTNTYNRKAGFSVMDEMLKYTASANIISSLCFIDLNNLKKINDQYGHEAGDAFITFCVKCLKDAFPEDTVIVRMGGDEFLLFLPSCTADCAFDQLEKVNATLMKESTQKGYPILWSFSYGCVEVPPKDRESLDTMITKADALMYVQKKKFKKNNQNSAE